MVELLERRAGASVHHGTHQETPPPKDGVGLLPGSFGFQGELGFDGLRSEPAGPFLVGRSHNSPQLQTEEVLLHLPQEMEEDFCPNARLVLGECDEHGQRRFVMSPCKKRTCPVCGPKGRYEIAKRIAYGVRQFWPCAWLVLTFDTEEAEESEWKPKAVKKLGKFVDWLRKCNPNPLPATERNSHGEMQYTATYELTQRGRLHINLVMGPWKYIPQALLRRRWGARVSVNRIRDDEAIGRETGKSYSPESLSGYLAKLSQAVPAEWGRRVSYSRDWPKLPDEGMERKGEITWRQEWELERVEIASFEFEREMGWWSEVSVGEWVPLLLPHDCHCFDLVEKHVPG